MTMYNLPTGESLTDYCKRTGLTYLLVWRRLIKGMDMTTAIEEAKKVAGKGSTRNNTKYYKDGMQLKEWCRKNGINENTIYSKISRGTFKV
jgi:hypothetical protein